MASSTISETLLSAEQIEHYRQEGYLIVRNLFSVEDIQEALEDAQRLTQRHDLIATENIRCRWQPHVKTQECLFECFDPVIDISPVCDRLAHDPRLLQVLGDLYGEEACLFKDKLIFKPPGAKGYDLHQDFIGWRDFPRSFLTALIAFDGPTWTTAARWSIPATISKATCRRRTAITIRCRRTWSTKRRPCR